MLLLNLKKLLLNLVPGDVGQIAGLNVERVYVEGANVCVARDAVQGLDEAKQPEHNDHNEEEPEANADLLHALAERKHDVADRFLFHETAIVHTIAHHRLTLKESLVVDALENEHTEAGEEEDLK